MILAFSVVFFPAWAGHAQEQKVHNSLGMEFVLVPAGMFLMGSPLDEAYRSPSEVQHPVTISRPFYMQTTEVTVDQWRAVMGRRFLARKKGSGDMPVVKVSWYDCKKFIRKLNRMTGDLYLLPTEAQWEYAARAGSETPYFWGSQIDCSRAMFANNPMKYDACVGVHQASGRPKPVKSYPPNAWGLYDMHGNVWEWCEDRFGRYGAVSMVDPCETESGKDRVRRGGSWFGPGYSCRSANRAYGHPMSRLQNTGFRLVMALPDR
ncbi:formylglycine-generating enzyme family protein [Desulfosarcina alkanivorans]|uniref:formylglycine-generating enzyme family protein n=1 Tax=Desulfosarcina alkanivorans TaxID=571177 RepID=UPI00142F0B15|nr:formylglycine-generating enzyme family protein [Desulfosarcina alkanivorans]